MKMVIDIDEDTYKDIKKGKIYSSYRDVPQESVLAIANGTPLPKGHGRLIDADAYKEKVFKKFPCNSIDDRNIRRLTELALKDAPTIIEADGGDTE